MPLGPGFETNLLVVLLVLGILAGFAWVLRAPLRRAYRYLIAWAEKDRREEEEQRKDTVLRQKAEEEVKQYFHQDETPEDQQVQKLGQ